METTSVDVSEISFSIIIPTLGKPPLARTLESIRSQPPMPGDEVLLIQDWGHGGRLISDASQMFYDAKVPGRTWVGEPIPDPRCHPHNSPIKCPPRNEAMLHATGTHMMFMDDDDIYTPGAFEKIRVGVAAFPDRLILCGTKFPSRITGMNPQIGIGKTGTPSYVFPNTPPLPKWRYIGSGDDGIFGLDLAKRFGEPIVLGFITCLVRPT